MTNSSKIQNERQNNFQKKFSFQFLLCLCSSVIGIHDLRTGYCDPWPLQHDISLSLLSIVLAKIMCESSQWFRKNIVRRTENKPTGRHG